MLRIALLALGVLGLAFGKEDPVSWTLSPTGKGASIRPGSKAFLELRATVEPGWHLYSPTTPPGGPIITKITLNNGPAISAFGLYRPEPVRKLDPNFNIDTETYSGSATFLFE